MPVHAVHSLRGVESVRQHWKIPIFAICLRKSRAHGLPIALCRSAQGNPISTGVLVDTMLSRNEHRLGTVIDK